MNDPQEDIFMLWNRILGNAGAIYGRQYPGSDSFEVLATREIDGSGQATLPGTVIIGPTATYGAAVIVYTTNVWGGPWTLIHKVTGSSSEVKTLLCLDSWLQDRMQEVLVGMRPGDVFMRRDGVRVSKK